MLMRPLRRSPATVDGCEDHRNEQERGDGREQQATDHCAAQGCVLLAAVAPSLMRSRAKLTTRMLFAVATPIHMIAPVSAGTLNVVPVMNSIQAMPARAAGNRSEERR